LHLTVSHIVFSYSLPYIGRSVHKDNQKYRERDNLWT